MKGVRTVLAVCLLGASPVEAMEFDWRGEASAEARGFLQEGGRTDSPGGQFSVALEPTLLVFLSDAGTLTLTPFARWDERDDERTHWDIREAFAQYYSGNVTLTAGVNRVFWGVIETKHLVDVVNQTDFVENIDGEDKLGQPMVHLSYARGNTIVDGYLLVGFRERTFPGPEGRPAFPLPLDRDAALIEAGDPDTELDFAARWSQVAGDFDLGLSLFEGIARDPVFVRAPDDSLKLMPRYDGITRVSFDGQFTRGAWLLKVEALTETGQQGDAWNAAASGGLEYTVYQPAGLPGDAGLLAEYHWDERDAYLFALFQRDVFLGTRLAFYDVASSEILAGVILDVEDGSKLLSLEASRRLGERFTGSLEFRGFLAGSPKKQLYPLRQEDFVQGTLTWHW